MLVCIFLFVFDMIGFYSHAGNCDNLTNNQIANDALWFASRAVSDFLWIIPLVFLFAPGFRKNKMQYQTMESIRTDLNYSVLSVNNDELMDDQAYFVN